MTTSRFVIAFFLLSVASGTASADLSGLLVSDFNSNEITQISNGMSSVAVPANSGGLTNPEQMAFGPNGNLFVTSYGTNQILEYDGKTGAFDTVFATGNGLKQPDGFVFGPDGTLYVSNIGTNQILKFNGTTGQYEGVFASGSGLNQPRSLVFGADGNLYVSNYGSGDVLRFEGPAGPNPGLALPSTGNSGAIFASGGGLTDPLGLTFGPDGNLYVASFGTNQVLKYDQTTGSFDGVFVQSGNGLSGAHDVAFGPDGQLYLSGFYSGNVLTYNGTTGAYDGTIASGLDGATHLLFVPQSVPEPSSVVLVCFGIAGVLGFSRRFR